MGGSQGAGHNVWGEQGEDLDEDEGGEQGGGGGEHRGLEQVPSELGLRVRYGGSKEGERAVVRILPVADLVQEACEDNCGEGEDGEGDDGEDVEERHNARCGHRRERYVGQKEQKGLHSWRSPKVLALVITQEISVEMPFCAGPCHCCHAGRHP